MPVGVVPKNIFCRYVCNITHYLSCLENSSVDRSGAAQGLAEVVGGLGVDKVGDRFNAELDNNDTIYKYVLMCNSDHCWHGFAFHYFLDSIYLSFYLSINLSFFAYICLYLLINLFDTLFFIFSYNDQSLFYRCTSSCPKSSPQQNGWISLLMSRCHFSQIFWIIFLWLLWVIMILRSK